MLIWKKPKTFASVQNELYVINAPVYAYAWKGLELYFQRFTN